MIIKRTYLLAVLISTSLAFSNIGLISSAIAEEKNTKKILKVASKMEGQVTEILNVGSYIYAKVKVGKEEVWAAAPTIKLIIGDKISFLTNMPMKNFHSESLNRDFPMVYFVNRFITDKTTATSKHKRPEPKKAIPLVKKIDPLKEGKTIAEIYTEKEKLAGKIVKVRGLVTKFTEGVMGKNWIHLRDNSTLEDLTITTEAVVKLEDVVVIEGKLGLDKDFGYGYVYAVMFEDAKVTKE
jgi:hypothetical protein